MNLQQLCLVLRFRVIHSLDNHAKRLHLLTSNLHQRSKRKWQITLIDLGVFLLDMSREVILPHSPLRAFNTRTQWADNGDVRARVRSGKFRHWCKREFVLQWAGLV
jgi:hypothetical protein